MRNQKVTFVCYADPPCPAEPTVTEIMGKIVTPPNAWQMPKAKKKAKECPIGEYEWINDRLTDIRGASIIDSSWNKAGGLIILGKIPLDYLIEKQITSLCACLLHGSGHKRKGITYLDKVIPTGFIPQSCQGGCNPGAIMYFPNAKRFNVVTRAIKLEGMQRKYKRLFNKTPQINENHVKKHFPEYDYTENERLAMAAPVVIKKYVTENPYANVNYLMNSYFNSFKYVKSAPV